MNTEETVRLKRARYYNRTDEQLVAFAGWQPAYEK